MENLLDHLTCPVCYEVPATGGLFQCPHMHVVCETCYGSMRDHADGGAGSVPHCLLCCAPYDMENGLPPRNRLGEALLDVMPMPCK